MNLQSETGPTGNVAAAAAPLQGRERRRREVLRLQFHTMGQKNEDATGAKAQAVEGDAESRLREEIDALSAKMKAQAGAVAEQMDEVKQSARASAREEWEAELGERIEEERVKVSRVCEEFSQERGRYFLNVEAEVVKLAVAIAARVLHREAKFDPLLLAAAVRVALEKVAEQSEVVLRVPAEDEEAWRQTLGESAAVQLIGDGGLHTGECTLETKAGRVDLGVSAQLAEIERGFFDLLQKRPA